MNSRKEYYEPYYNCGNFFFKSGEDNEIKIDAPLELNEEFNGKDFYVTCLVKKNLKENDVKEVRCKGNDGDRVGLLIPVQALSSNEHDYADKDYFLSYAYIAIREGFKLLNHGFFHNAISTKVESIKTTDIFHPDTAILVISRDTFKPGYEFDIDRSVPSFMDYGFIKLGDRSPDYIHFDKERADKHITIKPISDDVEYHGLIADILTYSFPYETKEASRFFYIYQIIELLIDRVYYYEHKQLFEKLIASRDNVSTVKDVIKDIDHISSEKRRISLLIGKYTNISGLHDLQESCNTLLPFIEKETASSFSEYFYPIRNFIFHQYRNFPKKAEGVLKDVVINTISIMPELLFKFSSPEAKQ